MGDCASRRHRRGAETTEVIHSGRALNHTKTGAGDLGRFRPLIPVSGLLTTTILSHPAPAGSFNHPFRYSPLIHSWL